MNPDGINITSDYMDIVGSVMKNDEGTYSVVTPNGLSPIGINNSGVDSWSAANITTSSNTVGVLSGASRIRPTVDQIMDEHSLNRIAVDHKVTAQELLKLQEVAPDYASEIKENIAKNLARDIAKKVMFKKKHDKDADVHHFIGRVWVFTDEELKELLQNVY
jgi:uncharacterized spore protein YtfJ